MLNLDLDEPAIDEKSDSEKSEGAYGNWREPSHYGRNGSNWVPTIVTAEAKAKTVVYDYGLNKNNKNGYSNSR